MNRDKWVFQITPDKLLAATKARVEHHTKRLEFWRGCKESTLAELKDKGLSVADSQAAGTSNTRYGALVVVDPTYQRQLNESHSKIGEHHQHVVTYSGWVEVLSANPRPSYDLNADDYLFFFGK